MVPPRTVTASTALGRTLSSFPAGRKRQRLRQCERQWGFRRDFDLFVAGQSAAHETCARSYQCPDPRALAATRNSADECTACGAATRRYCGSLSLTLYSAVQCPGLNRIIVSADRDAGQSQCELALALDFALFLRGHHRACHT